MYSILEYRSVTRYGLILLAGKGFFTKRFLPLFSPLSLIGLLYTIIVLFAYQGHRIIHNIGAVFRVFVPLILYFIVMWTSTFALIYHLTRREVPQAGHDGVYGYETAVVQAFTADFVSRHVSLECAFS